MKQYSKSLNCVPHSMYYQMLLLLRCKT